MQTEQFTPPVATEQPVEAPVSEVSAPVAEPVGETLPATPVTDAPIEAAPATETPDVPALATETVSEPVVETPSDVGPVETVAPGVPVEVVESPIAPLNLDPSEVIQPTDIEIAQNFAEVHPDTEDADRLLADAKTAVEEVAVTPEVPVETAAPAPEAAATTAESTPATTPELKPGYSAVDILPAPKKSFFGKLFSGFGKKK